jgi:outer membrane protein OmpA-like peptidoglycan-associated protein
MQALSEARARTLFDILAANGVDQTRLEMKGSGGSLPVASNNTLANRTKNRRVDIIIFPPVE